MHSVRRKYDLVPRRQSISQWLVLKHGEVVLQYAKQLLPTYNIFDERRHFEPGPDVAKVLRIGDMQVGVMICQDGWNDDGNDYGVNPFGRLACAGQFDGQGDHHSSRPCVRQTFRKYLECGIFAHGFARAWCDDCGHATSWPIPAKAGASAPRATRGVWWRETTRLPGTGQWRPSAYA